MCYMSPPKGNVNHSCFSCEPLMDPDSLFPTLDSKGHFFSYRSVTLYVQHSAAWKRTSAIFLKAETSCLQHFLPYILTSHCLLVRTLTILFLIIKFSTTLSSEEFCEFSFAWFC